MARYSARLLRRFLLGCLCLGHWLQPLPASAQTTVAVNVESTPAGATVYVDSTAGAPVGITPLRNARIPSGHHALIFRLDGHGDGRLEVDVRRRGETFRLSLTALATVAITAGHADAAGAQVRIDGQTVGSIPFRGSVAPGRHLVQVGREGFETFNQWVDVAPGQLLSMPVMLTREAPQSGSILVAGDISGAAIFIDGRPEGTTPNVIENVPVGAHQIEIRPDGLPPHEEQVVVLAGQRSRVNPTLRPRPAPTGRLRVMANVPGTRIALDGDPLGAAPVARDGVSAGEHIVEATADGYEPVQQVITVEPGQQRVVSMRLEQPTARPGRIVINVDVAASSIIVDGENRGPPPVAIDDAAVGTHRVVVTAPGYQDHRATCQTAPNRDCEMSVTLTARGTPIRVGANVGDATLYLDGEPIGSIPFEGDVAVGAHRLEVRADGYVPHVQQVQILATETPRVFEIELEEEGVISEEDAAALAERRLEDETSAVTHGATILPIDMAALDLSVGFPHLVELRLGVGIFDWLEAGFATRTFGRLTEFELRAKAGIRPVRQLGLALMARAGGGIGPDNDRDAVRNMRGVVTEPAEDHPTNVWFFLIDAMATLGFGEAGAFTLWVGADLHTDRWDFAEVNSDIVAVRDGERQGLARLRLGGALELVLGRGWNLWGSLEGTLAGDGRRILGDVLGFGNDDTELYFRLGFTYKF